MNRNDYLAAIDGLDGKRVMVRVFATTGTEVRHGIFRYDQTMPFICNLYRGRQRFRVANTPILEIKEAK